MWETDHLFTALDSLRFHQLHPSFALVTRQAAVWTRDSTVWRHGVWHCVYTDSLLRMMSQLSIAVMLLVLFPWLQGHREDTKGFTFLQSHAVPSFFSRDEKLSLGHNTKPQ
jgi:hypothetical protein